METKPNLDKLNSALSRLILSASGWRGIFACDGDGESSKTALSDEHRVIVAAAAMVFSDYIKTHGCTEKPTLLVGMDTRPTGPEIARAIIQSLLAAHCEVKFIGVCAAPEIMASARSFGSELVPQAHGFIYISASHNPIGYNGLKFGLLDGGVLNGDEASSLIESFTRLMNKEGTPERISSLVNTVSLEQYADISKRQQAHKRSALDSYFSFTRDLIAGNGISSFVMSAVLQNALHDYPLGIVADFNGSARTVSIDHDFWAKLDIDFAAINDASGAIVHRIVPEGESLDPCRAFLETQHQMDARFLLGYMPDCDGDRGNIVIWDDAQQKVRALEGQEVFALCCISELAHLVWTGELSYHANGTPDRKVAVAVNDATSMRIDKIASYFGAETFRAETGEANVVTLARNLRERGYIVRLLGEGAAGGNITHPSAVRDPLCTVMALVKLFAIRSGMNTQADARGFFQIWCEKSGNPYHADFTLSDIIATVPPFVTTNAYTPEAVLSVQSNDHSKLKETYQRIFENDWEQKKDELQKKYNIAGYFASGFNGSDERCPVQDWRSIKKGGLKITFYDDAQACVAALWMRGSGTEPVFRVMADVAGERRELERTLLAWQRDMIVDADKALCC
ncbi:MAG: phosphatidylglycerol lysyltransferase [Spirochaetaceae bacterium]|nr:phosphatidylglycerol lysyltransferase [Spirochaetaceae bacterium]